MHILYIHQYFSTRAGSTGTRSYEFAKFFVSKGHKVTIITGNSQLNEENTNGGRISRFKLDGINVICINNTYNNYMGKVKRIFSFLFFMFYAILESLKVEKYDIIFATSTPLTIGIPGVLLKKIKKKPFIFEVRDLWPEAPIQMEVIKSKIIIKLLKKLEKYIYNNADHIVALSPGMQDGIISSGINKTKITMIPNSCDLDLFYPREGNNSIIIEKYNLFGKFIAIHAGSMGEANGLDYVIKAAKILKDRNVNDILIILTGDGKTKPKLVRMCEENKLDNILFTGSINKSEVAELLGVSNVALTIFKDLPILATNSPNKFFDAISSGKPVIVNTNGWLKDIVNKEGNGIYVDAGEPEELADAIIELKKSPNSLKEMEISSRKLAEQQFDRIKLASQLLNIFKIATGK